MPNAIAMGVSYELFWHLNPKKLKAFYDAEKIKRINFDTQMWFMGQYVKSAVGTAVEHCLAGRKAQSKYVEKPFLMQAEINQKAEAEQLTEAEKQKQVELLFMRLQVQAHNFKQEQKKKQKEQDGIGA